MASVLNGYTAIINGLTTFIASPEYSLSEKRFLIATANSVSEGRTSTVEAQKKLDSKSKEAGKLFREWSNLGLTFLATMATVATFALAYQDSRQNLPLETAIAEKIDEILQTQLQFDLRDKYIFMLAEPPTTKPSEGKQNSEDTQSPTPNADTPNENRKPRRSSVKEGQSNFRK